MALMHKISNIHNSMKYYLIIALLISSTVGQGSTTSSQEIEKLKNNCRCINVMQCPKILNVLKILEQRRFTDDYYALMVRVNCGLDVNHPKVCCESDVEFEEKIIATNKCLGPEGQVGECLDIHECKNMLRIIKQKSISLTHRRLLQTIHCGFVGRHPKVCCNLKPLKTQEETFFHQDVGNKSLETCILPSGKEGSCVNIKQCPKTFSILKGRSFTGENRRIIDILQCGWNGKYPKICCESEIIDKERFVELSERIRHNNCFTYPRNTRKCIDIYECESMWKLMSRKKLPIHDHILEMARCSPKGALLKVYCDLTSPASDDTATISNNRPEKLKPIVSVRNHPNLKLLPHDICGPLLEARIVGGASTNINEFPWMALLIYDAESMEIDVRCGATLITQKYVLTAAHCVAFLPSKITVIKVRVGEYDLKSDEDCDDEGNCVGKYYDFDIEYVTVHECYMKESLENDIGLVRLQDSVDFRPANIRPICLPLDPTSFDVMNEVPDKAVVTGWGTTESIATGEKMQKIILPIVNMDACRMRYRDMKNYMTSDKQICAGGSVSRDSCTGDSGGPLQAVGTYGKRPRFVQYGVVSYGRAKCGTVDHPAIYTKVSFYVDWILDHIIN